MEQGTRVIKNCVGGLRRGYVYDTTPAGVHVDVAWDDANTEYRERPIVESELARYLSLELPLIDQTGLWWDIKDAFGRLFNTVRASDSEDALKKSDRQAYLIGIGSDMLRTNPGGAYAVLTPSKGVHPF